MSGCEERWEELLAGYVLGDLTPEEVVAVNAYLDRNPAAIAEVKALQETLALLPYALPENAQAPPQLQSRILRAATETPPPRQPQRLGLPPWRRQRQVAWAGLSAGLAAIAIGTGIDGLRLRAELAAARAEIVTYRQAIAMLNDPAMRLVSLQTTSRPRKTAGSLTIAPDSGAAMLAIDNLPPAPPGKVYRLWAIVDGQNVDCASFQPDASGRVFLKLPLAPMLQKAFTIAVTIEPKQATQPTGDMVLQGSAAT